MERLRRVRDLDPHAIVGCPRCMAASRGTVPAARLSWRGFVGALQPASSKRPQIRTARQYMDHLVKAHDLSPGELCRRDLPVLLWSPRDHQGSDLLVSAIVTRLAVSYKIQLTYSFLLDCSNSSLMLSFKLLPRLPPSPLMTSLNWPIRLLKIRSLTSNFRAR